MDFDKTYGVWMNGIIQTDVICLYKKINHSHTRVDCLEFDVLQELSNQRPRLNLFVFLDILFR